MEHDELKVRLLGASGRIDARALIEALDALLDLTSTLDESSKRPQWAISALQESSAAVAIRPTGEIENETFSAITALTRGVRQLEQEPGVPDRWHEAALRKLKAISSTTARAGVEGVELSWGDESPVRLDHAVLAHIDESLTERHMSLGSVRGKLDRYVNRRATHEFGLIDAVTGVAVKVQFSIELQEKVLAAMEKDVVAWGEVHRNSQGDKIRLKLEDFEVVDDPGLPEPVDRIVGVLGPDWTGGMGSVDWVREQRRG